MTLDALIGQLQALRDDYDGDTEVRLAQQPNWPFEYAVGTVEAVDLGSAAQPVVYIGEGRQLAYLPGAVAAALGW